ncbi:TIGR03745 family integrating conjugative element membrane protein [Salmonella enterica]|nr:TIGR03745 family integrating conjugative element membrane protein [Salmonella enterica]EIG0992127.1 TIGR03745 family integrating conjugative element membrane protein [Salmonella enterica]EIX9960479.1 TIGR03745 family integrating conjugative element membrane protein [Salmonella enterica]EJP2998828.1 TIGR03745 family integrating conjugative element membrane protein [Salmonella enterica]EKI4847612.1 TIGR03745 family integrating conjugative element membrane protein [Salmonella enterica]
MDQFASFIARLRQATQRILARGMSLALMYWLTCQPALADLPTVEPPESGGGSGLMGQIKGYLQDGIVIGGLVVAAIAFINVAIAAVHTFAEVRNEKATWTKFGAIIVVGVVLLVAVIWLLGKSASIIL